MQKKTAININYKVIHEYKHTIIYKRLKYFQFAVLTTK